MMLSQYQAAKENRSELELFPLRCGFCSLVAKTEATELAPHVCEVYRGVTERALIAAEIRRPLFNNMRNLKYFT
jgi:hypothetical protein